MRAVVWVISVAGPVTTVGAATADAPQETPSEMAAASAATGKRLIGASVPGRHGSSGHGHHLRRDRPARRQWVRAAGPGQRTGARPGDAERDDADLEVRRRPARRHPELSVPP